jgi:hypothetical protein
LGYRLEWFAKNFQNVTIYGYPPKPMIDKSNKLKMNITGSFHRLWTWLVLKRKVRELGLNIDKVEHCNIHHTEIILSGDHEKLWKAVDSAKTPSSLLKMESIFFEFSE